MADRMTPAQNRKYWACFNAAKAVAPDINRAEIQFAAIGRHCSSKDLSTNGTKEEPSEFDKVLGAFMAITDPDSLNAQMRQLQQPRLRLLTRIHDLLKCFGIWIQFPEAYAKPILQGRFRTDFLEELSDRLSPRPSKNYPEIIIDDSELEMMRNTLINRLAPFRRRSGMTEHEMCQRAGVPCFRANCAQCCNATPEGRVPRPGAPKKAQINSTPSKPLVESNVPF